ncbi:putative transmembrane protein [Gregarina niphandrodes]|uniref:Transmembrane protein n=1 Tax=Gregarina niphandrodes TaxID=110365 RepID=A0A023BBT6_GRENI|nr:putative transmembrane protein [Gregarina niphandrodes]EZG81149.1 putative transmembrane protein [Gregarina niphandrodes]|eukprot:XP_011134264.1 putative transmembrane protein [Gregarina niphandrodes]
MSSTEEVLAGQAAAAESAAAEPAAADSVVTDADVDPTGADLATGGGAPSRGDGMRGLKRWYRSFSRRLENHAEERAASRTDFEDQESTRSLYFANRDQDSFKQRVLDALDTLQAKWSCFTEELRAKLSRKSSEMAPVGNQFLIGEESSTRKTWIKRHWRLLTASLLIATLIIGIGLSVILCIVVPNQIEKIVNSAELIPESTDIGKVTGTGFNLKVQGRLLSPAAVTARITNNKPLTVYYVDRPYFDARRTRVLLRNNDQRVLQDLAGTSANGGMDEDEAAPDEGEPDGGEMKAKVSRDGSLVNIGALLLDESSVDGSSRTKYVASGVMTVENDSEFFRIIRATINGIGTKWFLEGLVDVHVAGLKFGNIPFHRYFELSIVEPSPTTVEGLPSDLENSSYSSSGSTTSSAGTASEAVPPAGTLGAQAAGDASAGVPPQTAVGGLLSPENVIIDKISLLEKSSSSVHLPLLVEGNVMNKGNISIDSLGSVVMQIRSNNVTIGEVETPNLGFMKSLNPFRFRGKLINSPELQRVFARFLDPNQEGDIWSSPRQLSTSVDGPSGGGPQVVDEDLVEGRQLQERSGGTVNISLLPKDDLILSAALAGIDMDFPLPNVTLESGLVSHLYVESTGLSDTITTSLMKMDSYNRIVLDNGEYSRQGFPAWPSDLVLMTPSRETRRALHGERRRFRRLLKEKGSTRKEIKRALRVSQPGWEAAYYGGRDDAGEDGQYPMEQSDEDDVIEAGSHDLRSNDPRPDLTSNDRHYHREFIEIGYAHPRFDERDSKKMVFGDDQQVANGIPFPGYQLPHLTGWTHNTYEYDAGATDWDSYQDKREPSSAYHGLWVPAQRLPGAGDSKAWEPGYGSDINAGRAVSATWSKPLADIHHSRSAHAGGLPQKGDLYQKGGLPRVGRLPATLYEYGGGGAPSVFYEDDAASVQRYPPSSGDEMFFSEETGASYYARGRDRRLVSPSAVGGRRQLQADPLSNIMGSVLRAVTSTLSDLQSASNSFSSLSGSSPAADNSSGADSSPASGASLGGDSFGGGSSSGGSSSGGSLSGGSSNGGSSNGGSSNGGSSSGDESWIEEPSSLRDSVPVPSNGQTARPAWQLLSEVGRAVGSNILMAVREASNQGLRAAGDVADTVAGLSQGSSSASYSGGASLSPIGIIQWKEPLASVLDRVAVSLGSTLPITGTLVAGFWTPFAETDLVDADITSNLTFVLGAREFSGFGMTATATAGRIESGSDTYNCEKALSATTKNSSSSGDPVAHTFANEEHVQKGVLEGKMVMQRVLLEANLSVGDSITELLSGLLELNQALLIKTQEMSLAARLRINNEEMTLSEKHVAQTVQLGGGAVSNSSDGGNRIIDLKLRRLYVPPNTPELTLIVELAVLSALPTEIKIESPIYLDWMSQDLVGGPVTIPRVQVRKGSNSIIAYVGFYKDRLASLLLPMALQVYRSQTLPICITARSNTSDEETQVQRKTSSLFSEAVNTVVDNLQSYCIDVTLGAQETKLMGEVVIPFVSQLTKTVHI